MDNGIDYNSSNKTTLIIILLLLVIAIGGCYIYKISTENNQLKQGEKESNNNKEDKDEKPVDSTPEEPEEKNENYSIEIKTLESKGNNVTANITLNGKESTLTLENNSGQQKDSIFTFGSTKLCFIQGWGTGPSYACAPESVDYSVVRGKDNKEYLFIYYQSSFDKHILILNEDSKIIKHISSKVDDKTFDYGCFVTLSDIEAKLYIIKDNNIYFYDRATVPNSYINTSEPINLKTVKIEITNNVVELTDTDEKETGQYAQCT